jgi:hypothetical protein
MSGWNVWKGEMQKWRGRSWRGPDAHWCYDWDELPVDAFTPEYDCCVCYPKSLLGRFCNWLYMKWFNRRAARALAGEKR